LRRYFVAWVGLSRAISREGSPVIAPLVCFCGKGTVSLLTSATGQFGLSTAECCFFLIEAPERLHWSSLTLSARGHSSRLLASKYLGAWKPFIIG